MSLGFASDNIVETSSFEIFGETAAVDCKRFI